ncbi:hypothetical protein [Gordonia caeni]|uniref:hypothetical protein n=1 Tax=Gordonia caeni TaxID=1007097 RepID=UPI0031D9CDCC
MAKRNAEQADKLRARAGAWGKALSVAMTTALGWVTLSQATDIFPGTAGDSREWAIVFLVLVVISIGGTWWWFNRQTRPLAMGLDIPRMTTKGPGAELSSREADDVARLYGELGELNTRIQSGPTEDEIRRVVAHALVSRRTYSHKSASKLIKGYAAEAIAKEALAEQSAIGENGEIDHNLIERAAQIRAEIYATQQRAMVTVIRRRTGGLVSGFGSALCLGVFIVGLVGLSYSLDEIEATRTESDRRLALFNECATTVENLKKQGIVIGGSGANRAVLPRDCERWSLDYTSGRATIADVQSLSDALDKCRSRDPAFADRPECTAIAVKLESMANELTPS